MSKRLVERRRSPQFLGRSLGNGYNAVRRWATPSSSATAQSVGSSAFQNPFAPTFVTASTGLPTIRVLPALSP